MNPLLWWSLWIVGLPTLLVAAENVVKWLVYLRPEEPVVEGNVTHHDWHGRVIRVEEN